jgi:hypothetical protein
VITPAIPEPLSGSAYFVSHGGEAFPDLTIVLKGYGVTVDLIGSTQIKAGVTTSTFKAAPDVPINSSHRRVDGGDGPSKLEAGTTRGGDGAGSSRRRRQKAAHARQSVGT